MIECLNPTTWVDVAGMAVVLSVVIIPASIYFWRH